MKCNRFLSYSSPIPIPRDSRCKFSMFILSFISLILNNMLILTYLDVMTKIFILMSEKN